MDIKGTTILSVRRNAKVIIIGDGQVTMGQQVVLKHSAKKVRAISGGEVICGFAGSTADAFTLTELLESKLELHNGNLLRSAVELAKEWRTDRNLRRLEAMLIAADRKHTFLITGIGDVIEPEEGIVAVGSGGTYALSAARALFRNTDLDAEAIGRRSMEVAAELCVFTNDRFTLQALDCEES